MAILNSRVRPSQQASDIGGLRTKLLGSVFPSAVPSTPAPGAAPSPTGPAPLNPANRTRAQAPAQQSAASRAAAAVSARIATNPVTPAAPPVVRTRANTLPTQSAGTINTNYVNSATAQGYNNVTPPNIFRGMRESTRGFNEGGQLFQSALGGTYAAPGAFTNARDPNRTRESFRNNVFVPSPAQARANLFTPPVPAASAIMQQPLAPQVGVPTAQFPPRSQFLNYLFPR